MDYKEIKLSSDGTYFIINDKKAFKTFISALKFHVPGLAPVQDETGWYHIDIIGQSVYMQRYKRAFGYYFDLASVVDRNNNWFHINTKGNRIYSENYAWSGNFQENLCAVRDFSGNYFHINKQGCRIYEENYKYVGDFKDGYAAVKLNNGHFKHIDCEGKDLNGKMFNDLGVYHKSFATAKDSRGWFHIDKLGIELYKNRYVMVEPFYNGYALVEKMDKKKIVIDEKGEWVVEI